RRGATLRYSSFGILLSFVIRASSLSSLHLPVFDELVRNFFQKTGWPLENVAVASTQSHLRKGEIKFIARAGDRHIKQTPLLLERVASVEGATAWKHAVSQPNNEHGIKFEPFGLMDGGKIDRLLLGRLIWRSLRIDIADQSQLGEKFVHVFELARKHVKLIQIFTAQFVICE